MPSVRVAMSMVGSYTSRSCQEAMLGRATEDTHLHTLPSTCTLCGDGEGNIVQVGRVGNNSLALAWHQHRACRVPTSVGLVIHTALSHPLTQLLGPGASVAGGVHGLVCISRRHSRIDDRLATRLAHSGKTGCMGCPREIIDRQLVCGTFAASRRTRCEGAGRRDGGGGSAGAG